MFVRLFLGEHKDVAIKQLYNYWKYIHTNVDFNNFSDYYNKLANINNNKYLEQSTFDLDVLSSLIYSGARLCRKQKCNYDKISPVEKLISPYGLCETYLSHDSYNTKYTEFLKSIHF